MLLKFNLGNRVKIRATGRFGEIIGYKEELVFNKGEITHSEKYLVQLNQYTSSYYDEEQLMFDDEIDPKVEKALLNSMIDYNLEKRNFELVKYYADLKKKLG